MRFSSKISALLMASIMAGAMVFGVKGNAQQDRRASELQMTLSTTTMMLCLGSPLPLKLELTNQSNEEVRVDKSDLWASFSYTFAPTDGSGRGGGSGVSCSHCRGNYVFIKPAGRYESSSEYLLNDFFNDAGKYTIKMNYEQVSTNELSFELYNCNPN